MTSWTIFIMSLNVLLIGTENVGKTSLVKKIIGLPIKHTYNPTIEDTFTYKVILKNGVSTIYFHDVILDLLQVNLESYLKSVEIILFIFSLNDRLSFKILQNWLLRIVKMTTKTIYLIGNKADLPNIFDKEVLKYSFENKLNYFETSVITGFNINKLKNCLIQPFLKNSKFLRKSKSMYETINPENRKIINSFSSVFDDNSNDHCIRYIDTYKMKKSNIVLQKSLSLDIETDRKCLNFPVKESCASVMNGAKLNKTKSTGKIEVDLIGELNEVFKERRLRRAITFSL